MASKPKKIKKYNKILSLDISENSIIAIEVQFAKNNVYISNGFKLNNPTFQDVNQTVELIKQNIKAYNIKTKEVIIGFSMQYFKLFTTPIPDSIPEGEIDSIMLQESNLETTKYEISWMPLKNTFRQELDGVNKYDVLGIALDNSLISFSKMLTQKCNLKPLSITPSFFGNGVFLDPSVSRNLTATLWISQIRSEFIIWSGQEPIYEHLFLTHQVKDQIFQTANIIQSQLQGTQISTIFAHGPFLNEVNLSQVPYNIQAFTFPNNFFDTGKVLQRINPAEIPAALGLGLVASNNFTYSSPNLLEPIKIQTENISNLFKDFAQAQTKNTKGFKIPFNSLKIDPIFGKFIIASVLILILTFTGNFVIQDILTPQTQTNQTTFLNRINLTQQHLAQFLNYEKTNKVLGLKVEFLSSLIDKRRPWSKILKEIATMTPKGLWIDRLEIKNDAISIFGRALNVDSVANFSINLNYTAKTLGKTKIIDLRKSQEEGFDIIEFEISTHIKDEQESKITENSKESKENTKQKIKAL